ncbi:GNAT family N-acetyltransferase [Anaerotruncus colihominis]|uniref:GNAT family N-acetyltransferase n=1 Tax=Anaerotruncus colihominis TaxID=169435 RepID=UPI00242EB22B|nr:GNAT family N-acetyltransferase [Anaerotruncus colihominis]
MEIIAAYGRENEMLKLVTEYTNDILQRGTDVADCLKSQQLDDELRDMKVKYGLPYGRMYLALIDENVAGCVALTKNDETFCEIKRLYVKPQYRGMGISKALTERVIADARDIGYKHMRLDTFPFMSSAIKLYEKYGFYYIEKYNDNPAQTAVFMQLDL